MGKPHKIDKAECENEKETVWSSVHGGGGEAVRKYRSEEHRLEGMMAARGRPPIPISTPGSGSRSHKAETPARAVQSKAGKDF